MQTTKPTVLVTGATGYIGARLVPVLLSAGYPVRLLVREPRKLERRGWKDTTVFQGDLLNPGSFEDAFKGVHVAYYLVHSMTSSGKDFAQKDKEAAAAFAHACSLHGVQQIIYLGGLGITGSALSEHLKSRQDTGDVLRQGTVPVTELRAAIIVGSGSASFIIVRDLAKKLPLMICPKWVFSKCEPIAIRHVLSYLVGVIKIPEARDQILEIGGGEILTYAEMMRQCAAVMGRKILIVRVPFLTPRLSSYWLNLVTQVPMSLARPLVEGLRHDVVCKDRRIDQWIPITKLSFKESVRLALAKESDGALESQWTDATTEVIRTPGQDTTNHYQDHRDALCRAPASVLFSVIEKIGGHTGWYHADWLWRMRALVDWIIGGVGMRRGRRNSTRLAVGDPIDFWRVEERIQDSLIVLRAEMKLPGIARLSFVVTPVGKHESRLSLQADFWPDGFWGSLYWYSVVPFHTFVFDGMTAKIILEAESVGEREKR